MTEARVYPEQMQRKECGDAMQQRFYSCFNWSQRVELLDFSQNVCDTGFTEHTWELNHEVLFAPISQSFFKVYFHGQLFDLRFEPKKQNLF